MEKRNNIVEITWLDACGKQKEDKINLLDISPSDLLIETKTYGILFKQDKMAILILQENSSEQVDYTVIPKSSIIDIKLLN